MSMKTLHRSFTTFFPINHICYCFSYTRALLLLLIVVILQTTSPFSKQHSFAESFTVFPSRKTKLKIFRRRKVNHNTVHHTTNSHPSLNQSQFQSDAIFFTTGPDATSSSLTALSSLSSFQGHFKNDHNNLNCPTKLLARNEPNYDTKEDATNVQSNLQLWLDLRQTSIAPLAALLHLTNDLWEELAPPTSESGNSFIVDKVVMDQQSLYSKSSVVKDIREEFEMDIGILVVKDGQLLEIDQDGNMQPFGKLIMVGPNNKSGSVTSIDNVDPLSILDDVSNREWVLLDVPQEQISNGAGTQAIFNLLELVSNSVSSVGSVNLLGGSSSIRDRDRDDSINDQQVVLSDGHGAGGVGMTCSSPSTVMELAAIIQSLSPGSKGYKTTDSGILVQAVEGTISSSNNNNNSKSAINDESNASMVNYAIVMPFDASLWKTASFLLRSAL